MKKIIKINVLLVIICLLALLGGCGNNKNNESSSSAVQTTQTENTSSSKNEDITSKKEDGKNNPMDEKNKKQIEDAYQEVINISTTMANMPPARWDHKQIERACATIFWHPMKAGTESKRSMLYDSINGLSNTGEIWIANVQRFVMSYRIKDIKLHQAGDKYDTPWAEIEFGQRREGGAQFPKIKSIAIYQNNAWHIYSLGNLIEKSSDSIYDGLIDDYEYQKIVGP